ncbi:MAG: pyruvate formate lyase-activating protein [Methanosarcinales archaeon]|nr:pyruvate formate lyase-activating protein [Methanosarcinales archaeon]
MQIMAIDVGMGTQDILLYDDAQHIENNIKMVLPSQTQIIARRISRATKAGKDVFLTGTTMGGGPSGKAVREHIRAGLKVFAEAPAALTLHDNLEKVVQMGVMLMDKKNTVPGGVEHIDMYDVDTSALGTALELFESQLPRDFAVAVQDHGEAPDMSNRVFRFRHFRELLEQGGELERFAHLNRVPPHLSRMQAVMDTLKQQGNNVLLMDTGPAAICGALNDNPGGPMAVVNIGNGHTLAAVVDGDRMLALFEHHTRSVDAPKLDDLIRRLCDGELDFDEIFNDGGHGCHIQETVGFGNIRSVIVTGPNRNIMEGSSLDVEFAAPHGDMMLTGCFGLVGMFKKKMKQGQ